MADGGFKVYVDYSKVRLRLTEMSDAVRTELFDTVTTLDVALVSVASALAPIKTGRLKAHIKGSISNTPKHVTGRATARTPYAAILEWGGTIPAHVILPNQADALAFMMDAGQLFAKRVNHPATTIKARYFMHDALGSMSGQIATGLEEAVDRGLAKERRLMATREQIMQALQARLTTAYAFTGGVTRRAQSPDTMATPNNPALALIQHEEEYERQSPSLPPRRTMTILAIPYIDVGTDINAIPASLLNAIQDAFDAALLPDDPSTNRCTLGGLVFSVMIKGNLQLASGDKTGKGMAVMPIEIMIP